MIQTKGLKKRYDGFEALRGLDLNVPDGAIYGLVGPNGAGKSTTSRLLTGVMRPDGGTIEFDGRPVWENPVVKAQIAYIPDELWFYP